MTITSQDIPSLYVGSSDTIIFTLSDASGEPFVLPLNGDIEWRLAKTAHAIETECILRKNLGDGILLDNDVAEVSLTRFDTGLLLPGKIYYHQLAIVDQATDDIAIAATGAVVVCGALQVPRTSSGSASMGLRGVVGVNAVKTP